jgi:3-methyladenine DNA glycosylase AlkD
MNMNEILSTLKKNGKAQTAAIYKRHGSGNNVYGVLTSDIGKLQKKIKRDHVLAQELWKSGNAEARILALQIADPAQLTKAQATRLVNDMRSQFLSCYLSGLVAQSPIAETTMREWMKSREEFVRENGYGVLSSRLKDDPDSVSDAYAAQVLATIEQEIHGSPNFARHAMNSALVAIGIFKPAPLCANVLETADPVVITVEGQLGFCHDAEHVRQEVRRCRSARGHGVRGPGGRPLGGSGESHLARASEAQSFHG